MKNVRLRGTRTSICLAILAMGARSGVRRYMTAYTAKTTSGTARITSAARGYRRATSLTATTTNPTITPLTTNLIMGGGDDTDTFEWMVLASDSQRVSF